MQIVCPHCATSYRIDAVTVGPGGRQVRCVRCHKVWLAKPEFTHDATDRLASELTAAAANLAPGAVGTANTEPDIHSADATAYGAAPPEPDREADLYAPDRYGAPHIESSPSIVPAAGELSAPPPVAPAPDGDPDSFMARRERLRALRKREHGLHAPSAGAVIFMMLLVLGGLIGWRKAIVRHAPQTASLYAVIGLPVNLRGVSFDNIRTSQETQDGVPVLVVEGDIGSLSNLPIEIPRLRFSLRNSAGIEIYSWTTVPPKNTLAAGERLAFRSRLASPPPDARNVAVRFFTKYDVVAGVR
jgi:predicted Zn finger-like uncharacterized protein